jgi:hypothetical protein
VYLDFSGRKRTGRAKEPTIKKIPITANKKERLLRHEACRP